MKHKYFSYCPEDGFDTHETLEDALLNANDIIPNYLDEGWSEDVTGVFVGTITHTATMCDKVERAGEVDEDGYDTEGEHWADPDWDYKCNYKMLPINTVGETVLQQRNSLIDALTPEILDWIRCGLATNGRLKDGDHPAYAKLRAAINACKQGGEA